MGPIVGMASCSLHCTSPRGFVVWGEEAEPNE